MTSSTSHVGLVALLLIAAIADVRCRRIPNAMCAALLACGAVVSLADPAAPRIGSAVAAVGLVFSIAFVTWSLRLCGGGDAKLATAAAVWVGLSRLPQFALATALCGGVLSVAAYMAASAGARRAVRANLTASLALGTLSIPGPREPGRIKVPYGVAIAAGTLYAVLGVTA